MDESNKKTNVYFTDAEIDVEAIDRFEVPNYIRWADDGYDVMDWKGNVLSHHKNPTLYPPKHGEGEPIYLNEKGERVSHDEFIK